MYAMNTIPQCCYVHKVRFFRPTKQKPDSGRSQPALSPARYHGGVKESETLRYKPPCFHIRNYFPELKFSFQPPVVDFQELKTKFQLRKITSDAGIVNYLPRSRHHLKRTLRSMTQEKSSQDRHVETNKREGTETDVLPPPTPFGKSAMRTLDYASGAIASDGHTAAQAPQSMQVSGSIT